MKTLRYTFRLLYIHHVFAKYGLDRVISELPWFRSFRLLSYLNPWHWMRRTPLPRGERICLALEALGPIFVKFGQAMSTRPDILPTDIAQALARLQDQVPAFSSVLAEEKIERALGGKLTELFKTFDSQPLASASISQVHAALMLDGRAVVVKVLRPKIHQQIANDLALMKGVARLFARYWKPSQRLKPVALVEEFERCLLGELDLKQEGANAIQLKRNFKSSPLLYVPDIVWEYTREDVLVMERIEGIPVTDRKRLEKAGIDIPKLAERGVEIFFTQVFRDSFFHADMHPGNIFVSPNHPMDPQYMCVDFGLMGSLSEPDQRYLAYNLYAFFTRDYRRVAELHIESGWVPRNTRIEVFEAAIRTVCEPIFELPLHQISFAQLLIQLFRVAETFDMEVQPQLILLQKTLLAVEGLGRQLYPELDLWKTAKPFLERWLKSKVGVKVFFEQLKAQLPFFAEQLPHLPRLLYDVLEINKTTALMLQAQLQKKPSDEPKRNRFQGVVMILLGGVLGYLIHSYW